QQALVWTPTYHSAGTYPLVSFTVSDGLHRVTRTLTVVIAPNPQPPTLLQPADFVGQEGAAVLFQLQASDPSGAALTYSSSDLPAGATLEPQTGVFHWTPDYSEHGLHKVRFTVSNGLANATETTVITVLNANAAPVFQNLNAFQVREGRQVQFR